MKAFGWLKTLLKSERGNVFVIGAATMPLLVGSAAFGVDTIQLAVWKRQLQRAADSSAIAGAYAYSQGVDTHDAVHNDLDKNRFPTLTEEETITVGQRLGFDRTVRVQLDASRNLPFMSIFTGEPASIVADATAALVDDGTFCMVSLYDEEGYGIRVHGNSEVALGCGMKTNAIGENTVITNGANATIEASPIGSRGGVDGSSNNFVSPTTLQPYSARQPDPLAYLPNPTAPTNCSTEALTPANVPTTGGTYCFASASVQPGETLALPEDTTIILNGGSIDFKGTVTGTEITFVMTGPEGAAGGVTINSQANLQITAPLSGPYSGVLFYRDRRAPFTTITINGGATSILSGALYFPTADLNFNGHASMNVQCLQMVGRVLDFGGSAGVTNTCPNTTAANAFKQAVVRLIA